ncbi:MAG: DNA topoisomerase I, partial [archaeon]
MPRKLKHQKKSREETTAEDYFPVDESDLKHTVKKEHKSIDRKSLEKVEILALTEKKKRRKTSAKKRTLVSFKNHPRRVGGRGAGGGTIKKIKEYRPQKISLKKSGYELIITEKPQAAAKIASALGKINKKTNSNVSYYEVERNGEKIIVACAVGHLFTLKQTSNYQVPVFDVKWVPNFIAGKGMDFTKKYYDTISKLAKNASGITIATDYDVEGEVIGMNVMKFICGQNDANRMKFSTLTDKELNQSYEQKSKSINWPNAFAGETRHYLDWFYGINLSRALMNAIKTTGAFRIMSVGRVQGPALNLITKKEKQIQAFKPEKFWQVFIRIKNSHELELKHNKDIFRKQDLKKFENLKGREIDVVTEKKSQSLPPLPPFDLTSLQSEAYKFHGITPARTLQIAQGLYLSGLISYPRTSSQKLPASIAYKEILEKLAKKYKVENLIKRDSPVEGKKSDPAHPSIYPTGNFQILSGEDEKIYNLIAKRFLSLFCEDAIIDNKTIKTEIDKLTFSVRGSSIRKKAWLEIYPMKMVEKEIPDFNGKAKITNLKFDEKETQPPKRYSPASIVTELEKRGLGTKATRANIIETLYDRGYIRERSIE